MGRCSRPLESQSPRRSPPTLRLLAPFGVHRHPPPPTLSKMVLLPFNLASTSSRRCGVAPAPPRLPSFTSTGGLLGPARLTTSCTATLQPVAAASWRKKGHARRRASTRQRALSSAARQRAVSSAARQRAVSSAARQRAVSSAARQRALSSAARQQALSSAARQRALSSAARRRALSSAARQRALSSAARQRALSSAARQQALSSAARQRALSSAARRRALSSAARRRALFSAARQRAARALRAAASSWRSSRRLVAAAAAARRGGGRAGSSHRHRRRRRCPAATSPSVVAWRAPAGRRLTAGARRPAKWRTSWTNQLLRMAPTSSRRCTRHFKSETRPALHETLQIETCMEGVFQSKLRMEGVFFFLERAYAAWHHV